jgi:hypothetical protein
MHYFETKEMKEKEERKEGRKERRNEARKLVFSQPLNDVVLSVLTI